MTATRLDGTSFSKTVRDSNPGKRPGTALYGKRNRARVESTSASISSVSAMPAASASSVCFATQSHPMVLHPSHIEVRSNRRKRVRISAWSAEKAILVRREEAFWSNWNDNRSKRPPPTQPAISGADRTAAILATTTGVTVCLLPSVLQRVQNG